MLQEVAAVERLHGREPHRELVVAHVAEPNAAHRAASLSTRARSSAPSQGGLPAAAFSAVRSGRPSWPGGRASTRSSDSAHFRSAAPTSRSGTAGGAPGRRRGGWRATRAPPPSGRMTRTATPSSAASGYQRSHRARPIQRQLDRVEVEACRSASASSRTHAGRSASRRCGRCARRSAPPPASPHGGATRRGCGPARARSCCRTRAKLPAVLLAPLVDRPAPDLRNRSRRRAGRRAPSRARAPRPRTSATSRRAAILRRARHRQRARRDPRRRRTGPRAEADHGSQPPLLHRLGATRPPQARVPRTSARLGPLWIASHQEPRRVDPEWFDGFRPRMARSPSRPTTRMYPYRGRDRLRDRSGSRSGRCPASIWGRHVIGGASRTRARLRRQPGVDL